MPYLMALAADLEGLPSNEFWGEFRRIIERAWVLIGLEGMADMHGKARAYGTSLRAQFAHEGEFDFDAGPFMDAVVLFTGRIPRLTDVVRAMMAEAEKMGAGVVSLAMDGGTVVSLLGGTDLADRIARGSFWATSTTTGDLVDMRTVLAGVMRGDIGGAELKQLGVDDFISGVEARGIRHLSDRRLETIYRNNLSGSYNAAAAASLEDADVREVMPLVMLVEIQDSRTRGAPGGRYKGKHWQMDGYVGTMRDFRQLGILPPNGHQCRGSIRGVSLGEAHTMGWVDENGSLDRTAIESHNGGRIAILASGEYPDAGFV